MPHISGIMWHLSFCDGLISLNVKSSGFSRVVTSVGISQFLSLNNIPSHIYTTLKKSVHLFGLFPYGELLTLTYAHCPAKAIVTQGRCVGLCCIPLERIELCSRVR